MRGQYLDESLPTKGLHSVLRQPPGPQGAVSLLVVLHLKDDRETQLPNLGIVPVYDQESKKTVWVNTSSKDFRKKLEKTYTVNKGELERFCRKNQINYLEINTKDNYVPQLIKLFKIRNKTMKRD